MGACDEWWWEVGGCQTPKYFLPIRKANWFKCILTLNVFLNIFLYTLVEFIYRQILGSAIIRTQEIKSAWFLLCTVIWLSRKVLAVYNAWQWMSTILPQPHQHCLLCYFARCKMVFQNYVNLYVFNTAGYPSPIFLLLCELFLSFCPFICRMYS